LNDLLTFLRFETISAQQAHAGDIRACAAWVRQQLADAGLSAEVVPTAGHPVVIGRRTYLAIGRPLRGRTNIVVTRDPAFAGAGIVAAPSLAAALDVARGDALRRGVAAIMVAGGADLYAQLIGSAARLEITRVHASPQGDAVFPAIDPAQWHETSRREHPAGPDDDAPFATLTYERNSE
jgi:dihydrofolate reductase